MTKKHYDIQEELDALLEAVCWLLERACDPEWPEGEELRRIMRRLNSIVEKRRERDGQP